MIEAMLCVYVACIHVCMCAPEIGLSRLAIERKLNWDGLSAREVQSTMEKLFHGPAQVVAFLMHVPH